MSQYDDYPAILERLKERLDDENISMRSASLAAEMNPGYVQSLIKSGTEASLANFAELCAANKISLSYVLFGVEMTDETLKLVQMIETSPEKRDHVIALLSI